MEILGLTWMTIFLSTIQAVERTVIWSVEDEAGDRHLRYYRGQPTSWIPDLVSGATNPTDLTVTNRSETNTFIHYGSVGADSREEAVLVYDSTNKVIKHVQDTGTGTPTTKTVADAESLTDLSVDWNSHQVYWTESGTRRVRQASYTTSTLQYRTFSNYSATQGTPVTLTTDPEYSYVIVALDGDSGSNLCLYSYAGNELDTSSVSYNVVRMRVDQTSHELYVVSDDGQLFVGQLSSSVAQVPTLNLAWSQYQLQGIAPHPEYFFFAPPNNSFIDIMYNNFTQAHRITPTTTYKTISLAIASPETQPNITAASQCPSKSCDYICVENSGSALCLCQDNYTLQPDGTTCLSDSPTTTVSAPTTSAGSGGSGAVKHISIMSHSTYVFLCTYIYMFIK